MFVKWKKGFEKGCGLQSESRFVKLVRVQLVLKWGKQGFKLVWLQGGAAACLGAMAPKAGFAGQSSGVATGGCPVAVFGKI